MYSRNRSGYQDRLKQLYLETGDQENYIQFLKEIIHQRTGNLALFAEYKKLFSEVDWIEGRDLRLFPTLAGNMAALPWFHEEGKWDLMIEAAEKRRTFYGFEKFLMKKYLDRGMKILVQNVLDQMERAKDRKGYRFVKRMLLKLKKYPGGVDQAQLLAEQFYRHPPRRPALHDELSEFIQKEE